MDYKIDLPSSIKADGDTGTIIGLASTFGNVDHVGDIIAPGAFTAALDLIGRGERTVAMLDHHNQNSPIGRWDSLKQTERGLEVSGRLSMGVQRSRELFELAKDGALGGMSIGFRSKADEYDQATGIRTLKQIDLFEVSLVAMPMNPMAKIEIVKMSGGIETIRDFEQALVSQLGFSRNAAKSIAAGGYRSDARDGPDNSAELADLLDAATALKTLVLGIH